MRRQDFILLIMNCEKYRYKAENQKNNWLTYLPSRLVYYHVIGNEELETEYKFDEDARVLYVKTKDDYNSLPHKVISAYAAVQSEFAYKYIFKTDDDQHLKEVGMLEQLMNYVLIKTPNYGGKLITIAEDHISEYYVFHPELPRNVVVRKSQYCNGRFYILSKIAVEDLLTKRDLFKTEYFEDYAVGYYLSDDIKSRFVHIQNDVFVDVFF
jgi:hypothetical protein